MVLLLAGYFQYFFYSGLDTTCVEKTVCYGAGCVTVYCVIFTLVMRLAFRLSFYTVFPFYYFYPHVVLAVE